MPWKDPVPGKIQRKPDSERRLRQANRLARVLRVINLLQARGNWTLDQMARELDCSSRTIYRDLAALELAGIPWIFDKTTGSYRVIPGFQFPILPLSEDELLGQALATSTCKAPGLDVSVGARPTTEKLAARLNQKEESTLLQAGQFTEARELKLADHSGHREIIRAIQLALVHRHQLKMVYRSPYEVGPIQLQVHPYRLCLVKNAWYLLGRPENSTEVLTLRVHRIRELEEMHLAAEIPSDFSVQKHFGNAWAVYRGKQTYRVQLHFEPPASVLVLETVWHPTQTSTRHPDGSVTLQFQVEGLEEIIRWILGWGGKVRVEAPEELRRRVLDCHQRALVNNRKKEKHGL